MNSEVARLVREERIVAAAELASALRDFKTASELFERACDWRRAAEHAMRAGDASRALLLAVQAEDDALAEQVVPLVAATPAAEGVARQLERRGDHAWAAQLFVASSRPRDAARAWERASEAVRAATLYEGAGDAPEAARVLEVAMRREPGRWELYVALGSLLLRYGKIEGAVRALQKVPASATERRRALAPLVVALEKLGLPEAAREAGRELDALGGAEPRAPSEPPVDAAKAGVKTRLYGRYAVLREVASSPTARVVECMDVVRGEHVAVKIFAGTDVRGAGRDALARFEREIRVLGTIDHPSVVPLRDYLPDGPALVLSWMGGGTLEEMMAKGTIAPARAVEIACAVLSALGDAHRLGVLHRDIKPANVLFDDAGAARLGDFGAAHLGDLSTTATAGVIGTLAYMSPEQREGRPATIQSDIYGVGVMLREMLTGERHDPMEVPRVRPSAAHRDLDARHDDVVLAMCDPDPARRPLDAFAARRALLALSWPHDVEPAAPRPSNEAKASEHPAAGRIEMTLDGRVVDRWTGRAIEVVPLSDRTLARAAAFARAGHPSLQNVLRVDRDTAEIWLEAPRGKLIERALTQAERDSLSGALDALHAAGVAHGSVDAGHVFVDPALGVVLRFTPECDATSTADWDRVALARLS